MTIHRRSPSHYKRFPYVRQSTVHPPSQFWHHGPRIKLEGDWLEEAGFYSNWRIKVTVHKAKLIIEPLINPVEAIALQNRFPDHRSSLWPTRAQSRTYQISG